MDPLIRGLFESFKQSEELDSLPDDDAFELFASSLALPDELLAQTELTSMLLDAGTPGVDLLSIEINGQIVRDRSEVQEIAGEASKLSVSVVAIQAKRSPSIDTARILKMGSTLEKFLGGGSFPEYPQFEALSGAFQEVFTYATKLHPLPTLEYYYVTTANNASVNDAEVAEAATEVQSKLLQMNYLSDVSGAVWGAHDIYNAWSKKNNSNEIDISLEKQVNLPGMPGIDQAILGVASASELLKMVTLDGGQLDERVFYENVRGFQGDSNPVNDAMLATMGGDDSALLMVLNNGVTVVAESYSPKPGDAVTLSGYQIVNGCQTTNCLYLSRDKLADKLSSTYVPMKIVVTSDSDIAAQIIRATNSQTAVRESDLVALSSFQKRLEEYYKLDEMGVNLTYERRAGQFYGKNVIRTRVVNINDQLRSVAAVVLQVPHSAARYPGRLYDEIGSEVFNSGDKLLPYVAAAFASYRLENAFRTGLESKFKSARYHILMAFAFKTLGRPFSRINSRESERDARTMIERLSGDDPVSPLRDAAVAVEEAAGGLLPTRDRLKGQPFTQDLLRYLSFNSGK